MLLAVVVPVHVVLAFHVELQVLLTPTVSAATVIAVPAPTFKVGVPLEPPPVKPLPAVTPVTSPVHEVAPQAIPSNLEPSLATLRPSTVPPKVILFEKFEFPLVLFIYDSFLHAQPLASYQEMRLL